MLNLLKFLFIEKPLKPHPRHIKETEAYYRVSMLWRLMSGLATMVHTIYLLIFLKAGIKEMSTYNLICIFFWVIIILLIKRGAFYTAYTLSMCEAVLHGILATYFTGIESGFFLLVIVVPIIGFINPPQINFFNIIMKVIFLILPISSLIFIWEYILEHNVPYNIPYSTLKLMFIVNISMSMVYISAIGGFFSFLVMVAEKNLEKEFSRSESLLLNILPLSIANRLKNSTGTIADQFSNVSVLFLDIVEYTKFSADKAPIEIVGILNDLFTRFDSLADKYHMEKIKTIGDAYMVVSGIPEQSNDHAKLAVKMAFSMLEELAQFNLESNKNLDARIGICSGEVVAGVIGKKKFIYDLWGDTVNTASRMESHGKPGKVQITESTWELIKDEYRDVNHQEVEIKGKGKMKTWLL